MTARTVRGARAVGRRPGSPDTRGSIVAAAREEFAVHGFAQTSLRSVARSAGVDPALVHHYFAGKDELFLAALDIPFSPKDELRAALDVPHEQLGETIIRFVLRIWDDPTRQPGLLAVLRSSATTEHATALLRDGLVDALMAEVSAAAGLTDPETRIPFVISQTIGLIFARYVLRLEPLTSMPPDQVAAHVGPTLQRYLFD